MKRHKRIMIASLSVLVLALALACGGGSPVSMSDVPVYDGASPTTAGDDPMVDMVIELMEENIAGEEITMETKTFSLPDGTAWGDVKSFYNDKLEDTDWESAEELSNESDEFKSVGWQRGSLNNEQLLIVCYLPDLLSDGATMIVMLFSE